MRSLMAFLSSAGGRIMLGHLAFQADQLGQSTTNPITGVHGANRGCFQRPNFVLSLQGMPPRRSSSLWTRSKSWDRSIVFFKPKTNLPDAEKARIDFHFQQIAECIGFDRFRLPVLSGETLLGRFESEQSPTALIRFVGDHLNHDTSELQFRVVPQQAANCGGGG